MNPFSLPVLGGALLVSSPALWNSVMGETPLAVGLSRYLLAVVLCWMGLSVVAGLVGPVPEVEPDDPEAETGPSEDSTPAAARTDESAIR